MEENQQEITCTLRWVDVEEHLLALKLGRIDLALVITPTVSRCWFVKPMFAAEGARTTLIAKSEAEAKSMAEEHARTLLT